MRKLAAWFSDGSVHTGDTKYDPFRSPALKGTFGVAQY